MKYSASCYADTFLELAKGKPAPRALMRNFLSLVRRNGDMPKLPDILRSIEKKLFAREGIQKVEVTAARDIRKELERRLRAEFGKNADIRFSFTPEIIGGAVIRVNDGILIDASVKRQLDKLFQG